MCNRYRPTRADAWQEQYGLPVPQGYPAGDLFPRGSGAFIRRARESQDGLEGAVGTWGLIPWFAKTPKLTYSTNNARSEELSAKATYKQPWARGQRCIIPAQAFWEPCWETGRNVWWRFERADQLSWSLAGLWNLWTDRETGEQLESYTMLTVNADAHPIMRRMHKPDPKFAPDAQDKRSVIQIGDADIERWLHGRAEDIGDLLRPPPMEVLQAEPEPSAR